MERLEEIITKETTITAFKNGCVEPVNVIHRIHSVRYQYQRNVWEIFNKNFGLIRIMGNIEKSLIIAYPLLKNGFPENKGKSPYIFDITTDEYTELKNLYFEGIDKEYSKSWDIKNGN